jgi:hypothetical protein
MTSVNSAEQWRRLSNLAKVEILGQVGWTLVSFILCIDNVYFTICLTGT